MFTLQYLLRDLYPVYSGSIIWKYDLGIGYAIWV